MFRMKKLHPPFGTEAAPFYESSYGEGMVKVVDGVCEVLHPDSKNSLIERGYVEIPPELEKEDKDAPKAKGKGRVTQTLGRR